MHLEYLERRFVDLSLIEPYDLRWVVTPSDQILVVPLVFFALVLDYRLLQVIWIAEIAEFKSRLVV